MIILLIKQNMFRQIDSIAIHTSQRLLEDGRDGLACEKY